MRREETRRGYLYVPQDAKRAVAVYAVEHVTIATQGVVKSNPKDERGAAVYAAAFSAPAPGLYKARVVVRVHGTGFPRWNVVRGARVGSPLDEIRKLTATARRRPDGHRPNPKGLRDARRSRALADGLRLHVLPLLTVREVTQAGYQVQVVAEATP